jgi:hypothetical protein
METETNIPYGILKSQPLARFFYRGQSHSHPVRRSVLIISTDKNHITGYEIREGETIREVSEAPVKTFRKDRIPKWGDYWRLRRYGKDAETSTLKRCSLRNLEKRGA